MIYSFQNVVYFWVIDDISDGLPDQYFHIVFIILEVTFAEFMR